MDKKEILNYLKNFSFCDNINCEKCICRKTCFNYYTIGYYYSGCCRSFLYIAEQCITKNNFKKLCLFLKEKCNGRFPKNTDPIDKEWFIPFFKNLFSAKMFYWNKMLFSLTFYGCFIIW